MGTKPSSKTDVKPDSKTAKTNVGQAVSGEVEVQATEQNFQEAPNVRGAQTVGSKTDSKTKTDTKPDTKATNKADLNADVKPDAKENDVKPNVSDIKPQSRASRPINTRIPYQDTDFSTQVRTAFDAGINELEKTVRDFPVTDSEKTRAENALHSVNSTLRSLAGKYARIAVATRATSFKELQESIDKLSGLRF